MEFVPTHPGWERLRKRITNIFAPRTDGVIDDTDPEEQLLAARITERVIATQNQPTLTAELQTDWKRLKPALTTMLDRYDVTRAIRQLSLQEAGGRQEFQNLVLGVLVTDAELREQFSTALPLPIPEWLAFLNTEKKNSIASDSDQEIANEAGVPKIIDQSSVEPTELSEDPGKEKAKDQLTNETRDVVELQNLANKILLDRRFFDLALKLADDEELLDILERILEDEHYRIAIKILKQDRDLDQIILCAGEEAKRGEYHQDAEAVNMLNQRAMADQLCELGDRLYGNGQNPEAITAYGLALQMNPELKQAYLGHAQASLEEGDYKQCILDYQKLHNKNDQDTDVYIKLGQVYLLMNKLNEAEACFRKVIELSTDTDERQQAEAGLSAIAHRIKYD